MLNDLGILGFIRVNLVNESTAAKLAGNLVNYCIVVYGVYITMWGPYCLTNCMY